MNLDNYIKHVDRPLSGNRYAIGDIHVTIVIQSLLQGVNYDNCVNDVLAIIERRTGKMVDGQFVKDS